MREKIINRAEKLFFELGYRATTLKAICSPLRIRPASLYFHFPGGKEAIYVEVLQRRTIALREHLELVLRDHRDLRTALLAFGHWYAEQPPMNMMLIAQMDMPCLRKQARDQVMLMVRDAVFVPLSQIFILHGDRLRQPLDPFTLVGTFCLLIFSVHTSAMFGAASKSAMIDYNVDLFLHGVIAK